MAKKRQLLFEMPFAMDEPILVNREIGIERASLRGRKHTFAMEVTLLDTPDMRLLRAGIVLAHRVLDGLGEWFLDAPGWQPWLPVNRAEPLGAAGDLPEEFAALVHPFRRRAPLGPVAALACERREWQLLDADGVVLAKLCDDKMGIRRGGLTTARYREVTVSPVDDGLSREQRGFIIEAMLAAGGARVEHFPRLPERIGAPATGLTDFPGPSERDQDASFERFVSWLFARRLDGVMRADLSLRSGQADDMDLLREQLAILRREVRSLAFALEPAWREELERNVQTVLNSLAQRTVQQLGEEYFAVLDALVSAIRAPRLGDLSQHHALDVLHQQAASGLTILLDRARSLTLASSDDRWRATLASAQQMQALTSTNRLLFGKRAKRVGASLEEMVDALRSCQISPEAAEPQIDLAWDPVTAFQEGRHFERLRQECLAARRAFLDEWPELDRRLCSAKGKGR